MDRTENRHIIKRQVLEVKVQGQANAEAARQEIGRVFRAELLPFISQILDQYSPPNVIHRIEQLEIDLGEVPRQTMGQEIERKFKANFAKQLVQAIQRAEAQASFADQLADSSGQSKFPNRKETGSSPSGGRLPVSNPSDVELFFLFLKTGRLPWWAKTNPDLLNDVARRLVVDRSPPELVHLNALIQREPYRKRMIGHLSDSILVKWAKTLLPPGESSAFLRFLERLPTSAKQLVTPLPVSQTQLRYALWEFVFAGLLESVGLLNLKSYVALNLSQQLAVYFSLPEEMIEDALSQIGLLDEFSAGDDDSTQLTDTPLPEQKRETPHATEQEEAKDLLFAKRFNSSEAIYIDNAGLVILWVFFTNFFDHIGWLTERVFKSKALQHRAVWALQYLADGDVAPPEYVLALNKVLCGLGLEEVLEPQEPLTEEEQSTCDEILMAVLGHAEALGAISIEGFQHSFLQREGILTYSENRWLLQVKKETHDILLNRLSWNYQIVKLPWMDTAIFVEW